VRYTFGIKDVPNIVLKDSKSRELTKAIEQGDLDLVKFYHETLQWHFNSDVLKVACNCHNSQIASFIWECSPQITPFCFLSIMSPTTFTLFADTYPWKVEDIVRAAFQSFSLRKLEYAQKNYPSTWGEHAISRLFTRMDSPKFKYPALLWMLRYTNVSSNINKEAYVAFITHLSDIVLDAEDETYARYIYHIILALNKWIYPSYPGHVCMTTATCNVLRTTPSPYGVLIRKIFTSRQCGCNNPQNH
jgi:hypothetical protein